MDEGFAVIGVIPVVALNAVVEQVTDVGVGVYQLQELQCFSGLAQLAEMQFREPRTVSLETMVGPHFWATHSTPSCGPQEVIAAPDQPCAMEQAL